MDVEPILKKLGLSTLPCPVRWTSKNLRFYELAAYFESENESWIEIRPNNRLSWLGYGQDIILAHELIHAQRKGFKDSYWEEVLAYQVAKHRYQRYLGPLFSTTIFKFILLSFPILHFFECSFLSFFLLIAMMAYHVRHMQLFKKLQNHLINSGLSESEALLKMIQLTKSQLLNLIKKSSSCVRNL